MINDKYLYLSFKNELEMYAGSNRSDEEFLVKIFDKTRDIFSGLHNEFIGFDMEKAVQNLTVKPNNALMKESIDGMKSLSESERDAIEDSNGVGFLVQDTNCDVRVKAAIEFDSNDIVSLEKALYILGRVFKNADQIDNVDLINSVFDYIFEASCKWGFKMFQSLQGLENESIESIDKNQYEALLELMQQLLPVIVESRIYDMIGASNMQTVVKTRIKQLKESKDSGKQQFKLFLLMYLLCDIDLRQNIDIIGQSLELIKSPILKYAIVVKIAYYMHFKVDEIPGDFKKDIDDRLKALYVKAQKNFNNKTSHESLSQTVNSISERRRIRRLGNRN